MATNPTVALPASDGEQAVDRIFEQIGQCRPGNRPNEHHKRGSHESNHDPTGHVAAFVEFLSWPQKTAYRLKEMDCHAFPFLGEIECVKCREDGEDHCQWHDDEYNRNHHRDLGFAADFKKVTTGGVAGVVSLRV